jgi:hypothetical protein
MPFHRSLFWDTEFEQIDYERNAPYIIGRVLMRGNLQDWYDLKELYGLEKIKREAMQIRYLDKKTLNFCSTYFDIPKEQFRCYTIMQSIQAPWNY